MRTAILAAQFVALTACASQATLADSARPVAIKDLRSLYAQYWDTMSPKDSSTKYDRPLLQLGLPTDHSLVLWFGSANSKVSAKDLSFRICDAGNGPKCPASTRPAEPQVQVSGKWNTARIEFAQVAQAKLAPDHPYLIEAVDHSGNLLATLTARTAPSNEKPAAPFSFAFYSCSKPFSALGQDEHYRSKVGFTASHINSWNLLRLRSEGQLSGWTTAFRSDPPIAQPSFVLGLGDQLYIDGDNPADSGEVVHADQLLGLFYGEHSDRWLIKQDDEDAALAEIYYRHFALPPFDRAARSVPFAMMWDDHDIRDGWGSQGDEHEAPWHKYYEEASSAFDAFQRLRSPSTPTPPSDKPVIGCQDGGDRDFSFDWGQGVHFFVADTRSSRGGGCVLSDDQLNRLTAWLAVPHDDHPQLYVLGLNAPISTHWATGSGAYSHVVDKELEDDIKDSWEKNPKSLAAMVKLLKSHFSKRHQDRLLVLSGDVHESGFYELSLSNRPLGWEIVSSGIANYTVASKASKLSGLGSIAMPLDAERELTTTFYGSIHGSPTFAEVVVDPATFSASVIFYPSVADPGEPTSHAKGTSNPLINLVSDLDGRNDRSLDYWTIYDAMRVYKDPNRSAAVQQGHILIPLFGRHLPKDMPPQQILRKNWLGHDEAFSVLHDAASDPKSLRHEDENATDWFQVFRDE